MTVNDLLDAYNLKEERFNSVWRLVSRLNKRERIKIQAELDEKICGANISADIPGVIALVLAEIAVIIQLSNTSQQLSSFEVVIGVIVLLLIGGFCLRVLFSLLNTSKYKYILTVLEQYDKLNQEEKEEIERSIV